MWSRRIQEKCDKQQSELKLMAILITPHSKGILGMFKHYFLYLNCTIIFPSRPSPSATYINTSHAQLKCTLTGQLHVRQSHGFGYSWIEVHVFLYFIKPFCMHIYKVNIETLLPDIVTVYHAQGCFHNNLFSQIGCKPIPYVGKFSRHENFMKG